MLLYPKYPVRLNFPLETEKSNVVSGVTLSIGVRLSLVLWLMVMKLDKKKPS